MLNRRGLLGVILAAPAVICTPGLLMPVRAMRQGFVPNRIAGAMSVTDQMLMIQSRFRAVYLQMQADLIIQGQAVWPEWVADLSPEVRANRVVLLEPVVEPIRFGRIRTTARA